MDKTRKVFIKFREDAKYYSIKRKYLISYQLKSQLN